MAVASPGVVVQVQQTQHSRASDGEKSVVIGREEFVVGQLEILEVVEAEKGVDLNESKSAIVEFQLEEVWKMLEGAVDEGLQTVAGQLQYLG